MSHRVSQVVIIKDPCHSLSNQNVSTDNETETATPRKNNWGQVRERDTRSRGCRGFGIGDHNATKVRGVGRIRVRVSRGILKPNSESSARAFIVSRKRTESWIIVESLQTVKAGINHPRPRDKVARTDNKRLASSVRPWQVVVRRSNSGGGGGGLSGRSDGGVRRKQCALCGR